MKYAERHYVWKRLVETRGTITNRQLARETGVNVLTIGRWKRDPAWEAELHKMYLETKQKVGSGDFPYFPRPRKEEKYHSAFKIYELAEGQIANKKIASILGVSEATVGKWKRDGEWEKMVIGEVEQLPDKPKEKEQQQMVNDVSSFQVRTLVFPVENKWIRMKIPQPHLTEKEWDRLMETLNFLKSSLVEKKVEEEKRIIIL